MQLFRAVFSLSPVSITTSIFCFLSFSITSTTLSFKTSFTPIRATILSFFATNSMLFPSFIKSSSSWAELIASIEKKSEHPIAMAIVNKAIEERTELEDVKSFKAIPGFGLEASTKEDKKKWLKRYRRAKRNLIVTELAVKELKAAQIMGAKGNDGMPKGKNNSSDLSDYIVKLEDYKNSHSRT